MTTTTSRQLPWIRLGIIWLIGTCAVAACFGITVTLLDDKPLNGLFTLFSDGEGSTGRVLAASAAGLAATGGLWWCRWRRGAPDFRFHYLGAVALGLLGYLAFWAVASVVGAIITGSGGNPSGVLGNLFLLFATGVLGAFLNLFNLLQVVPQVIWFWHRAAARAAIRPGVTPPDAPLPADVPVPAGNAGSATPRPAVSRTRRFVLLGWIAVACLPVYLDARARKRHRTITAVDFDVGTDVDKWLDQLGESNFEVVYSSEEDADSIIYSMKQFVPTATPFTFARKGLEVRWTNVFDFSVYVAPEHSANRGIRKAVCKHNSMFDSDEQARTLVRDTVNQFRRGSWQAASNANDKDYIDEDPSREITADEWLELMRPGTPLRWRWQAEGVFAVLHASLFPDGISTTKRSYSITLEFRQAPVP
jgi:hypothetical protein